MAYDQKKYYEDHVSTWKNFVKYGTYGTIGVIALVVLMAVFLLWKNHYLLLTNNITKDTEIILNITLILNKFKNIFFISIFLLLVSCSEYSFNELNPFKLLCSGDFDSDTNSCNIEADFPDPTKK